MARKPKAKMSGPVAGRPKAVACENIPIHRQRREVLPGEPLHIDWRKGPTADQILDALQLLLEEIAANGRINMVTSQGLNGRMAAKRTGNKPPVHRGSRLERIDTDGNAVVGDSEEAVRAWIYRLWTNVKSERNGYIWKAARVIKALALLVDSGDGSQMRRYTGYCLETDGMKKHEALDMLMDIALTVQVHPIALGVCSASIGEFVLPRGYQLEMSICENVFAYNNTRHLGLERTDGLRSDKNDSSRAWPIPPMVRTVKLHRTAKYEEADAIRVVVVIEHRNLTNKMHRLATKGKDNWRGILFVFTGGFPSLSTREFLHMLSNEPKLVDKPFLFISDHDPHAMTIYFTLKMGSRATAFTSRTTICPRLQWGGITIDRFEKIAREWPDREVEKRLNDKLVLPAASDALRATLRAEAEAKMIAPLLRGRARLNKSDKNRILHIFRYEVCSKEDDPLLYQDLLQMGMNEYGEAVAIRADAPGKKFSLAALADPVRLGIEQSILAILEDFNVQGFNTTQADLPLYSQGRIGFLGVADTHSPRVGKSQTLSSDNGNEQSYIEPGATLSPQALSSDWGF